jgi:hypothetical protein
MNIFTDLLAHESDWIEMGSNSPMIDIVTVKPLDDYGLQIKFSDGKMKQFDMKPYLDGPVFQILQNQEIFETAYVDYGTVVWCGGAIDMAPETLYMNGKEI